jgi:hypothetical protein
MHTKEGFQDAKKSLMKESKIIFTGTVRNAENHIKKHLENMDKCGEKFKGYAVILYENDSKDSTRKILEDNKKENYYYIFEDGVKEGSRTVRISNGRNKILDKVREINEDDSYDYMLMMDLDEVNESGKFVDTIETCFSYDDWDVLTANQSDFYYDLWALRKKGDMEYDCWEKVRENPGDPDAENKYVNSKFKNYPVEDLLEVDSAFGGAALYKIQSIPEECRYNGVSASGFDTCEHVALHTCMKEKGKKIFINTRFLIS